MSRKLEDFLLTAEFIMMIVISTCLVLGALGVVK